MNDHLISRSRFLDALVLDADNKTDLIQVHQALEKAVISPDEVRGVGEWLPHPNPQFIEVDVCSVCGLGTRKMYHCTDGVQTWDEKTFFRYCPWCGAKLQEPPPKWVE